MPLPLQQDTNSGLYNIACQIRETNCPVCKGSGPIEVYKHYTAISFLIMTQWKTNTILACRPCARNKQISSLVMTSFLGWWGFPWGLIMTPIQIVKNIGALSSDAPPNPTPELLKLAAHYAVQSAMDGVTKKNA